jgi:hypothetical protein
MPKKLPPAPSNELDAWYEWVSERCTLHIDSHSYDGKIAHVLVKPRPVFFVLISYRDSPDAREWLHELLRVPVQGTAQRPFADAAAVEWPGPPELQGPGQPWDMLYALYPDGRELHTVDVWEKPLTEICVAVGPAPHIYLEVAAIKQSQVWVQDDFGSVLVKDSRRPKQHDGYQGDERGRYSRTWLSRDKVTAVLRSSVGFTPGKGAESPKGPVGGMPPIPPALWGGLAPQALTRSSPGGYGGLAPHQAPYGDAATRSCFTHTGARSVTSRRGTKTSDFSITTSPTPTTS